MHDAPQPPTPRGLSISCREAIRLASSRLDRPLTWRERAQLAYHNIVCYFCRRYARQVAALHDGLSRHAGTWTDATAGALSDDEKKRIKETCSRTG